jgi:hypothetical protein
MLLLCFLEQFKIHHGHVASDWLRHVLFYFPKLRHLKSPVSLFAHCSEENSHQVMIYECK